jgi:molecular chaperone DnaK (HSP70)
VVLTVPASFDEGARALTLEAAQMAGLPRVQLLEEPKAAFHDWLVLQGDELAAQLADSRLVLVVDVGGGTTDLTLIRVDAAPDGGLPTLTRTAVGEHLMLGGDNMDLALAHQLETAFAAKASAGPEAVPAALCPAGAALPHGQGAVAGAERARADRHHLAGRRQQAAGGAQASR